MKQRRIENPNTYNEKLRATFKAPDWSTPLFAKF